MIGDKAHNFDEMGVGYLHNKAIEFVIVAQWDSIPITDHFCVAASNKGLNRS